MIVHDENICKEKKMKTNWLREKKAATKVDFMAVRLIFVPEFMPMNILKSGDFKQRIFKQALKKISSAANFAL